jgi:integrase
MITPLPRQAAEILRALEPVTGGGRFVFPSVRGDGRPMSENTLTAALARMGYADRQSAHGFRATARTMLVERLAFPENVVEMQLAHSVKDPNGRAYNRATLLEQRGGMLQAWADYLDSVRGH